MTLAELGWDDRRPGEFAPWAERPGHRPARVVIEFNHHYRVHLDDGEREAMVAGGFKHRVTSRAGLPAVGDWVVVRQPKGDGPGRIVAVLPRRSRFSRKAAGHVTDEQVVAANVDVVFVVMALDQDFSVRRLERYLLLAREGGAVPVVLLTKPDLCDAVEARLAEAGAVAAEAPLHVLNPRRGDGTDHVGACLTAGKTGALLGSSGVGKTTIINRLLGSDLRRTRDVRLHDSKGRHTTTHRELIALPNGAWLIDTPGMRELQLWQADASVSGTFDDVDACASNCHFTDCRHRDEPRCAVKQAVAEGRLTPERLEGYLKVRAELDELARQRDERALREDKRRGRVTGKGPSRDVRTDGTRGRRDRG